jgi:hypothetical protein
VKIIFVNTIYKVNGVTAKILMIFFTKAGKKSKNSFGSTKPQSFKAFLCKTTSVGGIMKTDLKLYYRVQ